MSDKYGNLPLPPMVTTQEAASIASHAKQLYLKLVFNSHLTKENQIGHVTAANTAIDLAELFHAQLKKRGYTNDE